MRKAEIKIDYNNSIDLVKLFLILAVMACHSHLLPHNPVEEYFKAATPVVEGFAIFTGYFMSKSAMSIRDTGTPLGEQTRRFLWHKFGVLIPYSLWRHNNLHCKASRNQCIITSNIKRYNLRYMGTAVDARNRYTRLLVKYSYMVYLGNTYCYGCNFPIVTCKAKRLF